MRNIAKNYTEPNPFIFLLENYLPCFRSHGLEDLNQSKLMKRVDSKFIVPMFLLPALLEELKSHYSILQIANNLCHGYDSRYYDTDDFKFYRDHHNGKANRKKVRFRNYVSNNTFFLEVKEKSNKGITNKTRIPVIASRNTALSEYREFLQNCNVPMVDKLYPSLTVRYDRVSLAHISSLERVTIDLNLRFSLPNETHECQYDHFVIVEVKQQRLDRRSVVFSAMKRYGIRQMKYSKYCMGLYSLSMKNLKKNNFLQAGRHIEKLNKAYTTSHVPNKILTSTNR